MSRRVHISSACFRRDIAAWILTAFFACLGTELGAQDKPAAPPPALPAALKGTLLAALPVDSALVVRIPNVKSLVEKLKSSPLGALRDHVDVKKALEMLQSKAGPELAKAEKELGFNPLDTLLSIEGEWVFALGGLGQLATTLSESLQMGQMPDNLSPDAIPILIAADAGAAAGKVHDAIEKLISLAQKEGAGVERFDFKGGKITRLSEPAGPEVSPKKPAAKEPEVEDSDAEEAGKKKTKPNGIAAPQDDEEDDTEKKENAADDDDGDDDDEPKKPNMQVFVGELGGRFYISLSRSILEGCMYPRDSDRADGLAAQSLFQETHQAVGGGDFFTFVNIKQVITSIDSALSTTFFAFFWQKLQGLLFGPTLNNFAASGSIDATGLTQTMFVHNAGASDGLLGVFKGEAFAPGLAAPVPSDCKTFSSSTFNPGQLAKIIKEAVQLAMSLQGQQADLDTLVESQVGVKFSELMAGLGNRMHSFSGLPRQDNPFASLNYILELKEEGGLKKVLKKVSEMAGGQFDAEKFKDREIYSADTGSFAINACAADKLLVLSTSRNDVEKVLTRTADAVAGGDYFKKAVTGMPAQVTMVGFNSPEYMPALIKGMAQQAAESEGADEEAQVFIKALGAAADAFGGGWSYGVWRDRGLYFTGKLDLIAAKK